MSNEPDRELERQFWIAANTLGFSKVERVHLLSGGSPEDSESFTEKNLDPVISEAMAELAIMLGLIVSETRWVHALMRNTRLPGLNGETIADCVLSGSPEKIALGLEAARKRIGVSSEEPQPRKAALANRPG